VRQRPGLTAEQRAMALRLRSKGFKFKEIGEQIGASKNGAHNAVTGLTTFPRFCPRFPPVEHPVEHIDDAEHCDEYEPLNRLSWWRGEDLNLRPSGYETSTVFEVSF
jgi:hypothetical protein